MGTAESEITGDISLENRSDRRDIRGSRSSAEIENDIEDTRRELDSTLDALEQKLSPGRLLDQALGMVREGSADGSNAALNAVRNHPVPFAMMGLGLGWLAVESSGGTSSTSRHADGPAGPSVPYDPQMGARAGEHEDEGAMDRAKEKVGEAKYRARRAKGRVSEAADSVGDRTHQAKERVSSAASQASDAAGDLTERARERAQQARRGFWNQMEENPLVMGAISFGLGLASGVAAPTTRAEDRAMGEASDKVLEKARETGRETAEDFGEVAKSAAGAAKEEASARGSEAGERAKERVRENIRESTSESDERSDSDRMDFGR